MKIVVDYITPPIPGTDRWSAYLDDFGPDASPHGEGKTAGEAVEDLLRQIQEDKERARYAGSAA